MWLLVEQEGARHDHGKQEDSDKDMERQRERDEERGGKQGTEMSQNRYEDNKFSELEGENVVLIGKNTIHNNSLFYFIEAHFPEILYYEAHNHFLPLHYIAS